MTPEQREEIKQASEELLRIYSTVPRPNCADEYQRFNRAANPAAILSLIAQVEALTVPQGAPTAEQYDEMLRAVCCHYGVGGYNSDGLIDPKAAESKLRFALDEQFRVGGELALKGDKTKMEGIVREAQANAVLGFAEAMVEVGIADSRIRLTAAGVAARILIPSTIPAIPGTEEGA